MEYVVPPVIIILVLRYGLPVTITWFFGRFVEPKAEVASEKNPIHAPASELSKAQQIDATRKGLDILWHRLKKTERQLCPQTRP